jgi:hypothetical protein
MRTYHQKKLSSRCHASTYKPATPTRAIVLLHLACVAPATGTTTAPFLSFSSWPNRKELLPAPLADVLLALVQLESLGNRGQANWAAAFRQIVFAITWRHRATRHRQPAT